MLRSSGKRHLTALAVALLAAAPSANAQTPTAFNTTNTNYIYVGTAGLNASTNPLLLYTSSSAANPSFTGGTPITGAATKINGVGINQQDGFLYGISFPGTAALGNALFYRIGANAAAQQVGVIPAPVVVGATRSFINTTAGFVDAAGNYWFTAYAYTGDPTVIPYQAQFLKFYLGRVPNVAGLPASLSTLTPIYNEVSYQADADFRTAVQSFLDNFNYVNPGASNGGFEDLAVNPVNGKFYTYYSYPDPTTPSQLLHRPAVINPLNWTASTVGTTVNTSPNREIAGAYFDPSGNYYVLFTNGQYSSVNLTTGALQGLVATDLPLASGNNLRGDLASNILAASPLPVRLETLTGYRNGSINVLDWKTALEEGVHGYDVERSDDGIAFAAIGYASATGSGSQYRYEDPRGGAASYRLRINNGDGKSEFSQVLYISGHSKGQGSVTIYPTLVTGNELNIQATGAFRVSVANAEGRLVSTGAGVDRLTMPFSVTPGQYFVTVTGVGGEPIGAFRVVKQ